VQPHCGGGVYRNTMQTSLGAGNNPIPLFTVIRASQVALAPPGSSVGCVPLDGFACFRPKLPDCSLRGKIHSI
jgi:hypothetical protein